MSFRRGSNNFFMIKTIRSLFIATSILFSSLFLTNAVSAQTFIDVPADHIHAENIERLTEYNIINGYSNGYFGVDDPILREHAILLIYKMLKDEKQEIRAYIPFTDVKTSDFTFEAIRWAYEVGIIDGTYGKFNPKDFVTREQMAKILVNAFDLEANGSYQISDVASNHWAYPYINTLRSHDLTKLYQNCFIFSSGYSNFSLFCKIDLT